MRLTRILGPALVAGPLVAGAVLAAAPPAFHPRPPVVRTLPDGLKVMVLQDRRLPIVQMQLLIPAGVAQESAETPGAASATAQLLLAGTSSRSAEAFALDVDRLGGSITGNAAVEFSTVNGAFLAADFDAGLELLADAVVNPIFPDEELAGYRMQAANMMMRMRDDPAALADEWLWGLAFEGHPYGRRTLGSLGGLGRLDVDAVRAFYRDYYRPDRAVLAIAGDVDVEHAFAASADRFANWQGVAALLTAAEAPAPPAGPRIRIVDRPGQAQSEVRIGLVGPPRADPGLRALETANQILGGIGSVSRLGQSLRQVGGLSYDMRSDLTTLRGASLVTLGTVARNDSVAVLVARMREELARMASQPPSEEEVGLARRFLVNGYPLQFQSLEAIITQWMAADFYGIPFETLDHYADSLEATGAAQVAEAARRWLDPARVTVVVVGPAETLRGPLAALGPVEVVHPEDTPGKAPVAEAPTTPPTPEEQAHGRAVLAEALRAHGGLERLRHVTDSTVEGEMLLQAQGNDMRLQMQQVRMEPFRLKFATRFGSSETGQVLSGSTGWLYSGRQDSLNVEDADSIGVLAMRAAFLSDIVHVLLAAAAPTTQVAWRGGGRIEGRDVDRVEVALAPEPPGGSPERRLLHFDAHDHRLLAMDMVESGERRGSYETRRVYRDYRTVDGVEWPFYEERRVGATRTASIVTRSVSLDAGVTEALFARPARRAEDRPRR
jgi:zinc protease